MADLPPESLLDEWRRAVAKLAGAAGTPPDPELLRRLIRPVEAQVQLFERALDEQRRVNEQLVSRTLEPVTRLIGVLEELAAGMREQADALRGAGDSLVRVASVMDANAAIIESATAAVRAPLDLAARAFPTQDQAPDSAE